MELKKEDNQEINSYTDGLIDVMTGNIGYSQMSMRYHGFQKTIDSESNQFVTSIEQQTL